jgi:hypothetical protein
MRIVSTAYPTSVSGRANEKVQGVYEKISWKNEWRSVVSAESAMMKR